MRLMTKEIQAKLPPLYSQDGLGGKAVAKFQLVRWYKSVDASLATPLAPEAKSEKDVTRILKEEDQKIH